MIFIHFALHCRGYDALFVDEERLNAEKTIWYRAFTQKNIIFSDRVQAAIDKLQDKVFFQPPQLSQFLVLLRDSLDTERAYEEACKNSHPTITPVWSDPVIKHAASGISWELRTEPKSRSYPLFQKRYLESLIMFENGNMKTELPNNSNCGNEKKKQEELVMKQYKRIDNAPDALDVIRSLLK